MGKDALYSNTANGMQFSTRDQDNDRSKNSCSTAQGNGGNWFNKCYVQNLNGQYIRSAKNDFCFFVWVPFKTETRCMTLNGNSRSQLKGSKMMIRPKN